MDPNQDNPELKSMEENEISSPSQPIVTPTPTLDIDPEDIREVVEEPHYCLSILPPTPTLAINPEDAREDNTQAGSMNELLCSTIVAPNPTLDINPEDILEDNIGSLIELPHSIDSPIMAINPEDFHEDEVKFVDEMPCSSFVTPTPTSAIKPADIHKDNILFESMVELPHSSLSIVSPTPTMPIKPDYILGDNTEVETMNEISCSSFVTPNPTIKPADIHEDKIQMIMDKITCSSKSVVPSAPTFKIKPSNIPADNTRFKFFDEKPCSSYSVAPSSIHAQRAVKREMPSKSTQEMADTDSDQEMPLELWKSLPFTKLELKLKPKQLKCPRKFIPDELKDEKYYIQRAKNAEAVRKSRKIKEERIKRMTVRLQFLEEDNARQRLLNARYEAERVEILQELKRMKQNRNKAESSTSGNTNAISPSSEEEKQQNPKCPCTHFPHSEQ